MARNAIEIPKFKSEDEEADWWASAAGREFLSRKTRALEEEEIAPAGSRLVAQLDKQGSIRVAIWMPRADVEQARKIAKHKDIGWQTLLKTLVHGGLRREARCW
ncbi:MAG: hypothetical protein ACLQGV_02540 [Bryobacteraceae bacterium]